MLRITRSRTVTTNQFKSIYSGVSLRFSSNGPTKQETPEELQRNKDEAAKLAMQSFKDLGTMFSGSTEDKETSTIDTTPIFEEPSRFKHLSLLHQGQVLQELQNKFDKSWKKLTIHDKLLGYYIYYGNWGPREKFENWNDQSTPFDLPFVESVKKSNPKKSDKITALPPVNLQQTPIRKDQFDTRKVDNVTKVFIYLTLFISLLALIRDKKIGEDGKPQEVIVRDVYEEERQQKIKQEEELIAQQQKQKEAKASRKWYYLWLK